MWMTTIGIKTKTKRFITWAMIPGPLGIISCLKQRDELREKNDSKANLLLLDLFPL